MFLTTFLVTVVTVTESELRLNVLSTENTDFTFSGMFLQQKVVISSICCCLYKTTLGALRNKHDTACTKSSLSCERWLNSICSSLAKLLELLGRSAVITHLATFSTCFLFHGQNALSTSELLNLVDLPWLVLHLACIRYALQNTGACPHMLTGTLGCVAMRLNSSGK